MLKAPYRRGRVSFDISVLLDGHEVSALVDTGADYSIIREKLAALLKKVTTLWNHTPIRTAGGHIVTPLVMCTARSQVRGCTFVASFSVLQQCSRDLIIGTSFLREHSAIIDIRRRLVTFATTNTTTAYAYPSYFRVSLRVMDDAVTLPPRATVVVQVAWDEVMHGEAVVESNHSLLLSQGVCVARSLVDLHDDHCDVFVTNVSYEHRHLFSGTVIAYADPVANVTECFASEAIGTAEAPFRSVDINPTLSEANKQRLSELLLEFDTCFARS